MKKILCVLCMLITLPVYATTMCALEDTVAVILDPSITGTGYTRDDNTMTWTVTFPYGTVYGVAACLSVKGGSQGATNATLTAGGGEREGQYCWCKVSHPVSSLWAFASDVGSAAGCASSCPRSCGNYVRSNVALRAGLFGSVAQ